MSGPRPWPLTCRASVSSARGAGSVRILACACAYPRYGRAEAVKAENATLKAALERETKTLKSLQMEHSVRGGLNSNLGGLPARLLIRGVAAQGLQRAYAVAMEKGDAA